MGVFGRSFSVGAPTTAAPPPTTVAAAAAAGGGGGGTATGRERETYAYRTGPLFLGVVLTALTLLSSSSRLDSNSDTNHHLTTDERDTDDTKRKTKTTNRKTSTTSSKDTRRNINSEPTST